MHKPKSRLRSNLSSSTHAQTSSFRIAIQVAILGERAHPYMHAPAKEKGIQSTLMYERDTQL